jgi:hypothetical protein
MLPRAGWQPIAQQSIAQQPIAEAPPPESGRAAADNTALTWRSQRGQADERRIQQPDSLPGQEVVLIVLRAGVAGCNQGLEVVDVGV